MAQIIHFDGVTADINGPQECNVFRHRLDYNL